MLEAIITALLQGVARLRCQHRNRVPDESTSGTAVKAGTPLPSHPRTDTMELSPYIGELPANLSQQK